MKSSPRRERRKALREARKERVRQEKEKETRSGRLRQLLLVLAAVVILGALGYWAYAQWTNGSPGEFVPSLGNRHVGPTAVGLATYNSDPPTSGPHLPSIARWGIHDDPILKELQVHNLEDGGVVVQYNCQKQDAECQPLAQKLATIARRYNHVILAPYPGMSPRIALTAWTRIDKLNVFDEKRIVRFIEAYIGIDHHPVK